eukprot:s232_g14.t1
MVEKGVAKMTDYEHIQDYISFVNHKLQSKLQFRSAHVMEHSPGRSSSEDPPVAPPAPRCGTEPSGRRRGPFRYPARRLRTKTSQPELEELAADADAALENPDASSQPSMDLDFAADEEAAQSMGIDT